MIFNQCYYKISFCWPNFLIMSLINSISKNWKNYYNAKHQGCCRDPFDGKDILFVFFSLIGDSQIMKTLPQSFTAYNFLCGPK